MTFNEAFFFAFSVLGGLALFIFGMNIMTGGLRKAAGEKLRAILGRTTRNRMAGLGLGTALGFLVHSSATTVMLVGFVNAGLMSLAESIAPILGANVGTTISMQVISLKLTDYAFVAIAVGLVINMVAPSRKHKEFGMAILGFGLLFLGMDVMSGAVQPHREALAPYLTQIDGTTWQGLLTGIGIATLITAVIQSSGATIGMCFALISAGVFTDLAQVLPIVLGAHIGTCATAMLGSIGTNIEARRTAVAHLIFNLFNVTCAALAAPYFLKYIPLTSSDLIHQTANLHTTVMIAAAAITLPCSGLLVRVVRLVTPSKAVPPQPSFLDRELLDRPEKAIYAAIHELQRVARICAHNFRLTADMLLLEVRRTKIQSLKLNEKVINEIKSAMKHYLESMTSRYLSRRQAILIQHVDRCMTDIERIGDHIDAVCDHSLRRRKIPEAMLGREVLEWLFALYESANKVLGLVIESLDPDRKDFQKVAEAILVARDEYVEQSLQVKADFAEKVADKKVTPIAGIYFAEYVRDFDRIVRHSKGIALAEKKPDFWIKRKKLDRVADEEHDYEVHEKIDAQDFLDKLQSEDYL